MFKVFSWKISLRAILTGSHDPGSMYRSGIVGELLPALPACLFGPLWVQSPLVQPRPA
jgi:hypothetical protein